MDNKNIENMRERLNNFNWVDELINIQRGVINISKWDQDTLETAAKLALHCCVNGPVGVGTNSSFPGFTGEFSIKSKLGNITNSQWKGFCHDFATLLKDKVDINADNSKVYKLYGDLWPLHAEEGVPFVPEIGYGTKDFPNVTKTKRTPEFANRYFSESADVRGFKNDAPDEDKSEHISVIGDFDEKEPEEIEQEERDEQLRFRRDQSRTLFIYNLMSDWTINPATTANIADACDKFLAELVDSVSSHEDKIAILQNFDESLKKDGDLSRPLLKVAEALMAKDGKSQMKDKKDLSRKISDQPKTVEKETTPLVVVKSQTDLTNPKPEQPLDKGYIISTEPAKKTTTQTVVYKKEGKK